MAEMNKSNDDTTTQNNISGQKSDQEAPRGKAANKKPKSESYKATHVIAKRLKEKDRQPLGTLRRIIEVCGIEFTERMVEKTFEVEANGGLMTADGSRRRTLGGVFFYIAKQEMTDEQRQTIFPPPDFYKHHNRPPSLHPEFSWDEKVTIFEKVKQHPGEADMLVEVKGRPSSDVEHRKDLVFFTMEQDLSRLGTLPRGVPEMPEHLQSMIYTVMMSEWHWQEIQDALKNDTDTMIVRGYLVYDPEIQAPLIFTTQATTKLTERQKVLEQAEEATRKPVKKEADPAPASDQNKAKAAKPKPAAASNESATDASARRLRELQTARATLEAKIAEGGPSAAMSKRLLAQTIRQIEQLEGLNPESKEN